MAQQQDASLLPLSDNWGPSASELSCVDALASDKGELVVYGPLTTLLASQGPAKAGTNCCFAELCVQVDMYLYE